MAIVQLPERPADKPRIGAALRNLARARLAPARDVRITRGIPVYGLDDTRDRDESAHPTLQGWRYLVFDETDRPILTVDIDSDEPDAPAGVISAGESAARLLEVLALAEAAAQGDEIEIRILEITAAGAQAVWLHGAEDRCLDMAAPAPGPRPLREFLQEVSETLEARLQAAAALNEGSE